MSTCAVERTRRRRQCAILRSWLQAWRITCPVCGCHLSAVGQGSATNSGESLPSLASSEEALGGERLLDDYAERGAQTWASPIDLLRLLLIRRDPKPIDPDHWIETPKVLDLVVPGFDRQVADDGNDQFRRRTDRSCLCPFAPRCSPGSRSLSVQAPKSSPNSMVGRSAPTTSISEPLPPGSSRRSPLLRKSHLCSIFETLAATNLMFKCSDDRKPSQSHV